MARRHVAGFAAVVLAVLMLGVAPHAARADVDDFVIDALEVDYRLDIDGEGRSTLETTERITAVFPEVDQNRGMIRDLPRVFDGHETALTVISVTDEHGNPRPFATETSGDVLSVVMAVPEGEFVHGAQTYVLRYTQRDVTAGYDDTGVDEFYWDVNGTQWRQPIVALTARLHLSEPLVDAFAGSAACYRGGFGATGQCAIGVDESGTGLVVHERELAPFEGVTIATAFDRGTFMGPPPPLMQRYPQLWLAGPALVVVAIAVGVVSVVRARRAGRTGRPVIAQYEPPEGVPVAVAAHLVGAKARTMTATLLDWAVRGKVRLLRDEAADVYGVEMTDATDLVPMEAQAYTRIFGATGMSAAGPGPSPGGFRVGALVWLDARTTRFGDAARALTGRAASEVRTLGLTRRAVSPRRIAVVCALLTLALAVPVVQAIWVGNFALMTVLLAVGVQALVWTLLAVIGGLPLIKACTSEGALLRDHYMGLREYIRLAEADRIRMLQSATGASVDDGRIVQVYERLLPYAVLFGQESSWQQELSRHYRQSAPEWVGGTGATAGFTSALPLSSFAGAVTAQPATSRVSSGHGSGGSFSSSRGGSSGGGFSGGGGGGGGSRGI